MELKVEDDCGVCSPVLHRKFSRLGHWLLTTDTWFNSKGGLQNRGGGDDGQRQRLWNSGGG
jgi:hypothetical protein